MTGGSLLLFQSFFVQLVCFSQGASTELVHFEAFSGKKVKEELNYHKEASFNNIHCALLCHVHDNCSTSSFDESDQSCHLSAYRVRMQDYSDRLIDVASWMVISKSECKKGWTSVGDSCYVFNEEWRNMSNAKNYCERRGGKLAEPRTQAAYEQLRSYLNYLGGTRYLVGLTDIKVEGKFVWFSDGSVPVYTAWGPNEPVKNYRRHKEDSVILVRKIGYRFADTETFIESFSICEI